MATNFEKAMAQIAKGTVKTAVRNISNEQDNADYEATQPFTPVSTKEDALSSLNSQIQNYEERMKGADIDPSQFTDTRNPLEKWLNLREGQNAIFDIFEIINRPQQALFGGFTEALEGGAFGEGLSRGWTGEERDYSGGGVLRALTTGSGKDSGEIDWTDFAGFALDVMADPADLAFLGTGKIAKGLDALSDVATKLDDVVDAGIKATKVTKDAVFASKTVKNMADTITGVRKAGDALLSQTDDALLAVKHAAMDVIEDPILETAQATSKIVDNLPQAQKIEFFQKFGKSYKMIRKGEEFVSPSDLVVRAMFGTVKGSFGAADDVVSALSKTAFASRFGLDKGYDAARHAFTSTFDYTKAWSKGTVEALKKSGGRMAMFLDFGARKWKAIDDDISKVVTDADEAREAASVMYTYYQHFDTASVINERTVDEILRGKVNELWPYTAEQYEMFAKVLNVPSDRLGDVLPVITEDGFQYISVAKLDPAYIKPGVEGILNTKIRAANLLTEEDIARMQVTMDKPWFKETYAKVKAHYDDLMDRGIPLTGLDYEQTEGYSRNVMSESAKYQTTMEFDVIKQADEKTKKVFMGNTQVTSRRAYPTSAQEGNRWSRAARAERFRQAVIDGTSEHFKFAPGSHISMDAAATLDPQNNILGQRVIREVNAVLASKKDLLAANIKEQLAGGFAVPQPQMTDEIINEIKVTTFERGGKVYDDITDALLDDDNAVDALVHAKKNDPEGLRRILVERLGSEEAANRLIVNLPDDYRIPRVTSVPEPGMAPEVLPDIAPKQVELPQVEPKVTKAPTPIPDVQKPVQEVPKPTFSALKTPTTDLQVKVEKQVGYIYSDIVDGKLTGDQILSMTESGGYIPKGQDFATRFEDTSIFPEDVQTAMNEAKEMKKAWNAMPFGPERDTFWTDYKAKRNEVGEQIRQTITGGVSEATTKVEVNPLKNYLDDAVFSKDNKEKMDYVQRKIQHTLETGLDWDALEEALGARLTTYSDAGGEVSTTLRKLLSPELQNELKEFNPKQFELIQGVPDTLPKNPNTKGIKELSKKVKTELDTLMVEPVVSKVGTIVPESTTKVFKKVGKGVIEGFDDDDIFEVNNLYGDYIRQTSDKEISEDWMPNMFKPNKDGYIKLTDSVETKIHDAIDSGEVGFTEENYRALKKLDDTYGTDFTSGADFDEFRDIEVDRTPEGMLGVSPKDVRKDYINLVGAKKLQDAFDADDLTLGRTLSDVRDPKTGKLVEIPEVSPEVDALITKRQMITYDIDEGVTEYTPEEYQQILDDLDTQIGAKARGILNSNDDIVYVPEKAAPISFDNLVKKDVTTKAGKTKIGQVAPSETHAIRPDTVKGSAYEEYLSVVQGKSGKRIGEMSTSIIEKNPVWGGKGGMDIIDETITLTAKGAKRFQTALDAALDVPELAKRLNTADTYKTAVYLDEVYGTSFSNHKMWDNGIRLDTGNEVFFVSPKNLDAKLAEIKDAWENNPNNSAFVRPKAPEVELPVTKVPEPVVNPLDDATKVLDDVKVHTALTEEVTKKMANFAFDTVKKKDAFLHQLRLAEATEEVIAKIDTPEGWDMLNKYADQVQTETFKSYTEKIAKYADLKDKLDAIPTFEVDFQIAVKDWATAFAKTAKNAEVYQAFVGHEAFSDINTDGSLVRFVPFEIDTNGKPLFEKMKFPHGYEVIGGQAQNEFVSKIRYFNTFMKDPNMAKYADEIAKMDPSKGKILLEKNMLRIIQLDMQKGSKDLLKIVDFANNLFKRFKLLTPGFNIRNVMGISTNMWLSGMSIPEIARGLSESNKLWSEYDRIMNLFATNPAAMLPNDTKMYNTMKDFIDAGFTRPRPFSQVLQEGLTGTGSEVQDIQNEMLGIVKEGQKLGIIGKTSLANGWVNESMDALGRTSVMMKAMDPVTGKAYMDLLGVSSPAEAVRLVMFDPNNVSAVENSLMKRVAPFYTFTKMNLVYHMENMPANARRYYKLYKAMNATWDMLDINEEDVEDYKLVNMYLPLPGMKEDGTYYAIKANLPNSDFAEWVSNPLGRALSAASPLIKAPFEILLNKNVFTGREISEFKGQKSTTLPFLDKNQEYALGQTGIDAPARSLGAIGDLLKGDFGKGLSNFTGMGSIGNVQNTRISNAYKELDELKDGVRYLKQEGIDLPTLAELENQDKGLENVGLTLDQLLGLKK